MPTQKQDLLERLKYRIEYAQRDTAIIERINPGSVYIIDWINSGHSILISPWAFTDKNIRFKFLAGDVVLQDDVILWFDNKDSKTLLSAVEVPLKDLPLYVNMENKSGLYTAFLNQDSVYEEFQRMANKIEYLLYYK